MPSGPPGLFIFKIFNIMEKVIFKRLFNYMKTNNILSKCQSGFLPNDSTVNQLIEIYHNIISNMTCLIERHVNKFS
jgi:hypothetical protein